MELETGKDWNSLEWIIEGTRLKTIQGYIKSEDIHAWFPQ